MPARLHTDAGSKPGVSRSRKASVIRRTRLVVSSRVDQDGWKFKAGCGQLITILTTKVRPARAHTEGGVETRGKGLGKHGG